MDPSSSQPMLRELLVLIETVGGGICGIGVGKTLLNDLLDQNKDNTPELYQFFRSPNASEQRRDQRQKIRNRVSQWKGSSHRLLWYRTKLGDLGVTPHPQTQERFNEAERQEEANRGTEAIARPNSMTMGGPPVQTPQRPHTLSTMQKMPPEMEPLLRVLTPKEQLNFMADWHMKLQENERLRERDEREDKRLRERDEREDKRLRERDERADHRKRTAKLTDVKSHNDIVENVLAANGDRNKTRNKMIAPSDAATSSQPRSPVQPGRIAFAMENAEQVATEVPPRATAPPNHQVDESLSYWSPSPSEGSVNARKATNKDNVSGEDASFGSLLLSNVSFQASDENKENMPALGLAQERALKAPPRSPDSESHN